MTSTAPTSPAAERTDRIGYLVAAMIHAALLWGLNVWPGWQWVPFLTDDLTLVLELINLSLMVSLVANFVYAVAQAPWVRPLGELATTGIGIAVLVRLLQVFPFSFDGWTFEWSPIVRVLLIVGVIGSVVALVVQSVALVRALVPAGGSQAPAGPRH
jgi:hypothetical protein